MKRCIIYIVFMVVGLAISSSTFAQDTKASSLLQNKTFDFSLDSRLALPLDIQAKWVRLDHLVATIQSKANVELSVDREVAGRRINAFTRGFTAGRNMTLISRLTGLSWKIENRDKGVAYRLFLSEARRKKEKVWQKESIQREVAIHKAETDALTDALLQEIKKAGDAPSFGRYLSFFTPEELANAAEIAQEPMGPISASDQAHFRPFLLYATPYDKLPAGLLASLRKLLNRAEYTEEAGTERMKSAAESQAVLEGCQIGLIASSGTVRLGLFNQEENDIWVSPFDAVSRTFTVPSGDLPRIEENDYDPTVATMLDDPKLVVGLPRQLGNRTIRFPRETDRVHLANLMEFVARETGIRFVCDDFLLTRTTPYADILLPTETTYRVRDALHQIARTFGHRMVYENGVVYVTTLTPGRDLRAEPPTELLERFTNLITNKLVPGLEDYLAVATLTPLQLQTLNLYMPVDLMSLRRVFGQVQQIYPAIHLYTLLTPEQRQSAESEEGLASSSMSSEARKYFHLIQGRGVPHKETMSQLSPNRLYVRYHKSGSNQKSEGISAEIKELIFLSTSSRNPVLLTDFRLSLNITPSGAVNP